MIETRSCHNDMHMFNLQIVILGILVKQSHYAKRLLLRLALPALQVRLAVLELGELGEVEH